MRTIIAISTIFCLLCLPAVGYEVRTTPPKTETGADRIHYPAFAKRFTDTLKTHPPVSDCHVLLHTSELADFVDKVEIAIKIDREALVTFLTEQHKIRFVSQKDQDRYLESFKSTIRKAAADIFTDIKNEAISVNISYSE